MRLSTIARILDRLSWVATMMVLCSLSLLMGCVELPSKSVEIPLEQNNDYGWLDTGWTDDEQTDDDHVEDPNAQPTPQDGEPVYGPEQCDRWDNDGDGLIDEDTGGDSCTLDNGDTGKSRCVRGVLECQLCSPGEVREEACGCNTVRVDVCSSDGTWRLGACDGCETPTDLCECVVGDEMYRRCDTCSDDSCGTTCSGALWRCNDACSWEQVSACESLNPQCNRDQVIHEPCGWCGNRKLECDGCFWIAEPCMGEGVCAPGEGKSVPCFGEACAEGYAATIACNDQCDWDPPTECVGCLIGAVEEQIEECVPGYACGEIVTRTTCALKSTDEICESDRQVPIGEERTVQLGECIIVCIPGETREESCTLADGRAGSQMATCSDTCEWGPSEPCGAVVGSCIPETVETEERTCGTGACAGTYTRISTCKVDGSGWTTSTDNVSCPTCSEGQTSTRSCTTALGECGTQQVTCDPGTCVWNPPEGECQPRPTSCIPGTVEMEQQSCGANTCDATYRVTRTCRDNGCGWDEVADTSSCPDCIPGAAEQESCMTADDRCGIRNRECGTSTCSWSGWSACEPLPSACSNGAIENRPCSGLCGAQGTEVWECMDCMWTQVAACDATPPCNPGEEEILSECRPGVPECGYQTRTCDSNCNWVESGCPICG